MKEGWEIKKLTDVLWFQEGPGVRKHQYVSKGIKLLNVANLVDGKVDLSTSDRYISIDEAYGKYKHFLVDEGDLILASSGIQVDYIDKKLGFIKREHLPLCMNTSTIRFKTLDVNILNIVFFKYFLKSYSFKSQLFRLITGVAQLNFGPSHLKQMFIPVPAIAEQEKIVAELDCLSGIIEKKKQQLKEYDALAQSLFYEMFGDPVEKIKDWETFRLEDLCDIITKGTTPTTLGYKFVETGINFLKVESFSKDETIDDSKIAHITSECHEALKRSSLQEDDILLCIAGATVGRLARVPKCVIPANTNQAFAIIRLKKENSDKLQYIYSYLHSPFIQDIVVESKKGVSQPNLTLSQVRNFKIVIPPDDIRDIFVGKINLIEKNKRLIAESIKEVETLFNSRMDYYFN